MSSIWSLETHGDPLGKVRDLIRTIWLETGLDGMLVTMNEGDELSTTPRFITNVSQVNEINPFKPLMEINAARLIPELVANHPNANIAALLRPCELRALTEMTKITTIKINDLLTICVDCLGTLPTDEYQWRMERMEKNVPADGNKIVKSNEQLAHEALKFARQGGIVPYRYRSACQVCTSPAADSAKINIQVLGLPVRQQLLVMVNDPALEKSLPFEKLVDGKADKNLIVQHDRLLSKMSERHQRTMEQVNAGLGDLLPTDVDAVIRQLESCGNCQDCMQVCPICSIHQPIRSSDGHYDREEVIRWLVSCAGCGMCEQSCPNHLPIYSIFAHIREQLSKDWEHIPGQSQDEPLPSIK